MKRGAAPAKPHTDKQKTKPTAPTKRREKKNKKRDWREDFFCVAAPQPKGPIFPMKKKQSQNRVQWRRGTAGSAKRRETAAQEAKGGPLCMRRRWAGWSTSFASFFLPQYLCAGCGEQPKGAPRHRRKKTLSLLVGVGAIARRGHWEQKKGDGVCGKKKNGMRDVSSPHGSARDQKADPLLAFFFFRNTCH